MGFLSAEELKQLLPAETSAYPSPIPTQSVSSDEFMPAPQTEKQREFEARIKEFGGELARKHGMSRMGTLVKGLGADHVVWGSDAVWTGSPQWQIEALRRLEIPADMQKKHGFKPLGPADGPIKRAIFGENNARLYHFNPQQRSALESDRFAKLKVDYESNGTARSNLTYGYIRKPTAS